MAGGLDRMVPAATVRAAYRKQRRNPALTEFEVLPGRAHSFPVDSGWRDVADTVLAFLAANGLTP